MRFERSRLVWTACLLLSGCAHTAVVQHWQPPGIDVSSMQRLSVAPFDGEHGDAVAATLESRLWEHDVYTLVSGSELGQVVPAADNRRTGASLDQVLIQSRAAGLDGVIVGDVVEYRCDEHEVKHSPLPWRDGRALGRGPSVLLAASAVRAPTLVRQGTVTVVFRLVDVETGDVRVTKRTSHHFDGRSEDQQTHLPARCEILDNLLTACVDEFVALLAPQEVREEVKLATANWFDGGALEVLRGVRLARAGSWNDAESAWQAALQKNPDSDAALFNLALAAAHREDYTAAEDYAMQALRLVHTDCYADGLEQIRRFRAEFDKAQRQSRSPVVAAGHETAR